MLSTNPGIMKNILALIVAVSAFLSLSAQEETAFYQGVRLGLGTSDFRDFQVSPNQSVHSKIMYQGGYNALYMFNNSVGFESGVLVSLSGAEISGIESNSGFENGERTYRDHYRFVRLTLPFAARGILPINKDFSLTGFVGPAFNFNLAANQWRRYENGDEESDDEIAENLSPLNSSVLFGFGVKINHKDGRIIMLDARFSNDINAIFDGEPNGTAKLNTFSLSISVGI